MDNRIIIFAVLVTAAVITKLAAPRAYAFLKPLPLIFILALAFLKPAFPPTLWLAAVLFGLIGDIWLLSEKGFLPGLLSFLLGHIFYIFAFEQQTAGRPFSVAGSLAVTSISALAFAYLAQHLARARRKKYILPVFFYITVTAILLLISLRNPAAPYAIAGVFFFAASDFLLAFNKFVRPTWYVQAAVSVTYFAAQWLLAVHFGAL